MKKKAEGRPITRRECLAGGGTALLLAAGTQPAQAAMDPRLSTPPGHRKDAPGFRRISLDK